MRRPARPLTLVFAVCSLVFTGYVSVLQMTKRKPVIYEQWETKLKDCKTASLKPENVKCFSKNMELIKDKYNSNIHITWDVNSLSVDGAAYSWWKSLQPSSVFLNPTLDSVDQLMENLYADNFPMDDIYQRKRNSCRSCAVVGNSHILRNTCYGKLIDSHDVVIRFNEAVTKGYEDWVGSKTTHLLAYPESCPENIKKETSLMLLSFKAADLRWLKGATSDGSYRLWSYRNSYDKINVNKEKIHVFHPEFLKYVFDSWSGNDSHHPSSGLIGTVYALHICDKISLFGFGADENGLLQHYFEIIPGIAESQSRHNVNKEQKLFDNLSKSGVVDKYV